MYELTGQERIGEGFDVKFEWNVGCHVLDPASGRGLRNTVLKVSAGLGSTLSIPQIAVGAENEHIMEALGWTVVFLMAMPYAIISCVAGWIFYQYTRSSRKKVADNPDSNVRIVKKGESRG